MWDPTFGGESKMHAMEVWWRSLPKQMKQPVKTSVECEDNLQSSESSASNLDDEKIQKSISKLIENVILEGMLIDLI